MNGLSRWGWTLLLVVGTSSAWPQVARCEAGRAWYLSGGAGTASLDVKESINPKPDLGFRIVATGGCQFQRNLAVEFDTGFIQNTFSKSRNPNQREGTFNQVPLVFNGLYSFANSSKFEPFLGAGIGVIYVRSGGSDGGDVSLSFKGGVRYRASERVAIGTDYTFFMLGFLSAFIGEAVGVDTGNLTLRWTF